MTTVLLVVALLLVAQRFGVGGADGANELALAVEAVIGEPVSISVFPCFAGKYREVRRVQADRRQ